MDEEYCGNYPSTSTPTAGIDAAFDGDAHINSDDMSAQDVEDFVDGLDGQGANLADYVVEQGTDGIWTYRKWNNGTAECWGIWEGNLTHYYTGNGLYGYSLSPCTFPTSLFTGVPTVNADGRIGNGFYVGTSIDASASSANIVAMGTASGTNACKFHISAKGVWK